MSNRGSDKDARGTRVAWSEEEKHRIVRNAVDIQRQRPELSGLSLIRAAIAMLPPHRRRKLISLSQVAWFDPYVETESRLREVEGVTASQIEREARVTADVIREVTAAIQALKESLDRIADRIK